MSVHLVLIDALNLIRRIYAVQERPFLATSHYIKRANRETPQALSDSTKKQVLFNTQQACTLALKKIVERLCPTHALVVFDSQAPCWRYTLYPDYKKGRKKIPDHLAAQLPHMQDDFMTLNIDSLTSDEDEADDLIATLAIKVALRGQKVTIVSTDKGFLPLINHNIEVYDHFNRRYLDAEHVQNKFNIKPSQLVDFWMLTGDSTNKIPGITGIGQITASALLNQYGSLAALLKADDVKIAIKEKLENASEQLVMTRKLLTLKHDIPLGFNLKDIRIAQSSEAKPTQNIGNLQSNQA